MPHDAFRPADRAAARRPLIIGHRGASGYRPEHSPSAYRLAFAQGVDAVEPDIVASKDGVLVVRHENEISGTTDVASRAEFADRRATKIVDGVRLTGWFTEDFTWAELQTLRCRERLPRLRSDNTRFDGIEPILRLSEVLDLVGEDERARGIKTSVVVEIKHAHYFLGIGHDLGELLVAELVAAGWADREDQLIIESFELGVLDRLRAAGVQAQLVFLTESIGTPADEAVLGSSAHSWPWYRSDEGLDSLVGRVDGISVAKADLLTVDARGRKTRAPNLVQRAHERGLLVYTWTLRPENAFLNPAHTGAGGKGAFGNWRTEWRQVIATGVDGIFVDHPDLAQGIFA
ncbi:glycerophosphodiester phosphodiesterase family protein [Leucobacter sp. W1478]|uniref:glycerophosphodiester phosphodiesterase family protein n=1 Tax=Leucobacter sp. W1478 TaxID=3439065 RepID=UPI003F318A4B